MWYICEVCGAVSRNGAEVVYREMLPFQGVIDEAFTMRSVELCEDCAKRWEEEKKRAEVEAAGRFFGKGKNEVQS